MLRRIFKGSLVLGVCAGGYVSLDIYKKRKSKLHSWSSMLNHYMLINSLKLIGKFMNSKLIKDTSNCVQAQEETLLQQIRENAGSKYGTDHRFSEINSREDFVRLHPLTTYDHYKDYVDAIAEGEKNIMTTKMPEMLGVTSGTSGQSKLMPTSSKLFANFFTNGIAVLYYHMLEHFPCMTQLQKTMKFFYTPRWRTSPGGLLVGPNSSTPKSSKNILSLYATPPAAFDILTEPEARYVHLLFGLYDRDLGMIEANFCSLVYTAFQDLRVKWPKLVRDIEAGQIDPDLNIDPKVREKLNALLKPDPQRAQELKKEFEKGFQGIAKRIWPHCGLVFCVTTGANEIYKSLLEDTDLEGIPMFSPLYGATEGLLGLNIEPQNPKRNYLLALRSMFYEFIPIDQVDDPNPQTLFVDQVKDGEVYEMVLTNLSGFYRFRFGDVVKVNGFQNQCPQVEFQYRQGQFLNIRGEKTSEKLFYSCLIGAVSGWSGVTLVDYCCVESVLIQSHSKEQPQKSAVPHYVAFVETDGGKIPTKEEREKVEQELCEKSFVYNSFRRNGSIGPLHLHVVKPGTFSDLKQFVMENSDTSANQFKVPRVIKKPEMASFLISKVLQKE